MPTILVVDDSPTIRDVVALVLEGHRYETRAAADGRQALALLETETVDLVLLDFVMPVMNGYQFCRHLRADARFSGLPVVLMSAKGDKIRGQFVQQTGAIDAITKPFDPRALLAVVEGALKRASRDLTSPAGPRSSGEINIGELDGIADVAERSEAVRTAFVRALSRRLAEPMRLPGSELETRLDAVLDMPAAHQLAGILRLLEDEEDGDAALSGDLSFISLPEVMQMLELQRQSGALRMCAGDQEIALYLANGRIDIAKSKNLPASFRLGRFLVEDSVVSRELLEPLASEAESDRLLGEELIERSRATEEQIREALRRQTSELVYEAVRWRSGRFYFENNEGCPEATLAALQLAPGGLLMEGFRRVDEWQLIEGSFKFDDVLRCDEAVMNRYGQTQELTAQEELVLASIDGKRTVRQIVNAVDASTFDVCKALYQFLQARLVRRHAL